MAALAVAPLPLLRAADDPDETPAIKELQRREENVGRLSIDEQLKVRAAQQKALETPAVKAAIDKRDKAIVEFRDTLRAAMIAADPSVQPILDKVVAGPPRR